jgi:hypothetical protein
LAFLTVGSVAIALTSSSWWWLGAVAMFAMFAFFLVEPIHLKRRLEMLLSAALWRRYGHNRKSVRSRGGLWHQTNAHSGDVGG